MEPRIIKTEDQYQKYLQEVERLAAKDPDPNSKEGCRLELLAKLAEDYENERITFRKPDPIEAIEFRMEQQGLRQKDLANILGGKNRASEVLARKRPLTLSMIRALHERLKIPPELLIQEAKSMGTEDSVISPENIPVDLLLERGWIESRNAVSDMLKRFMAPTANEALLKQTTTFGARVRSNRAHVWLWLARVREIADSRPNISDRFSKNALSVDLLQYVAKLSWMDKGPRLAREFLEEQGIPLIIEPHLPKTHIDGAAMISSYGTPLIAMTLRENRLDNFWFVLMHELVHAWKHLNNNIRPTIADEDIEKGRDNNNIEKEANDLASAILIPKAVWRRSDAHLNPTASSISALARELQISPAIVAGRVRFERKNYSLFPKLVGYRRARSCFPEIQWT